MRGSALFILCVAGCSFEGKVTVDSTTADNPLLVDAAISDDPDAPIVIPIDAPPPPPSLFAAAGADIYRVDVDLDAATRVGTVMSGATAVDLQGLAFDGTRLLGLDATGANLLLIDPLTADLTATIGLSVTALGGLTVIPSADNAEHVPIVLAAKGSTLYRISATSGQVTTIGTFSSGYTFFTDLAWVSGHGLVITLSRPTAPPNKLGVRIDPLTAGTIAVVGENFDNIRGLSGYRGMLWGFTVNGNLHSIDPATGTSVLEMGSGPAWSEAAN